MRRAIWRWLWQGLRPVVREWLSERALRLPQSQRSAFARRFGVPVESVEQLEQALRQLVLYQIERWEP